MSALYEMLKPDFLLHHAVWGSLVVGLTQALDGLLIIPLLDRNRAGSPDRPESLLDQTALVGKSESSPRRL